MWNISNSTEDIREGREIQIGKKPEKKTNHERLWTLGNNLRVSEGRKVGGRR